MYHTPPARDTATPPSRIVGHSDNARTLYAFEALNKKTARYERSERLRLILRRLERVALLLSVIILLLWGVAHA